MALDYGADHPRSCGANLPWHHIGRHRLGSSPLVRGQRTGQSAFQRCVRIIPARAGPTSCPSGSSGNRPDHPRSCGANPSGIRSNADLAGSSPLVRGQHASRLVGLSRVRIIPARAGPTSSLYSSSSTSQDHPRSCGANVESNRLTLYHVGSSPLVRGQLLGGVARALGERIIPARAGPTSMTIQGMPSRSDHPRSCGANRCSDSSHLVAYGSSPLVRGQRRYSELPHIRWRIIPARAGPTRGRSSK